MSISWSVLMPLHNKKNLTQKLVVNRTYLYPRNRANCGKNIWI